jgi:hypothetical protein
MKKKMRKFAEGGFSAAQEEWLGGADRTDPYILARMRSAVPDESKPTSRDFDAIDPDMVAPSRKLESKKPVTKTITKTEMSVTKPQTNSLDFSRDEEGNKLPKDVKKPYVAIPKNAAGMQQFRSDATSPIGNLLRKITGSKIGLKDGGTVKKMSSGGKVKSASSRADGCAIRGKTRA